MTTLTKKQAASRRSTRRTSSRSGAGAPPEPFTLTHWRIYAGALVLDNGEFWTPEPFQEAIVADLFAGYQQLWAILPEGNAKTTLLASLCLYYGDFTETAFIPIGAASREQAEIMYRQAEGFVYRSPQIASSFKCQEGYRRIKCLRTGGRIQVYAADDRTADGVIPGGLAAIDELHRLRHLALYRTWAGKLIKRGAQLAAISTAGAPGSEFEETRARILAEATEIERDGCHVRAVAGDVVMHDWALPDRKLAKDFDLVAEANPLRSITPAVLERKRETATMSESHWLRFVCNIAARPEGQGILPDEWDRLGEKSPAVEPGSRYGFLDLGWKIDTTGIGVINFESNERRVILAPKAIKPPVDEGDIVAALLDRQQEFEPVGWVYDPNAGGQQMAQLLEKGEHPQQKARGIGPIIFIEHSQSDGAMALAAQRFEEALRLGWIRHDGNAELRRHVLNAVKRALSGERFRYDRPSDAKGERRAQFPIDLLTGVVMAHSVGVAGAGGPAHKPSPAFFL